MYTVRNKSNPGYNIGRYFTEWEAQQAADDLNKTLGTTEYYVKGN